MVRVTVKFLKLFTTVDCRRDSAKLKWATFAVDLKDRNNKQDKLKESGWTDRVNLDIWIIVLRLLLRKLNKRELLKYVDIVQVKSIVDNFSFFLLLCQKN